MSAYAEPNGADWTVPGLFVATCMACQRTMMWTQNFHSTGSVLLVCLCGESYTLNLTREGVPVWNIAKP